MASTYSAAISEWGGFCCWTAGASTEAPAQLRKNLSPPFRKKCDAFVLFSLTSRCLYISSHNPFLEVWRAKYMNKGEPLNSTENGNYFISWAQH